MKPHTRQRMKAVLAAAHREKAAAPVPDGWQQRAMARIRALPTASARRVRNVDEFMGLSWRFAAAACVLVIVLLSVAAFQNGSQTEYDMARLFIGDPLEYSLVQSMGIY